MVKKVNESGLIELGIGILGKFINILETSHNVSDQIFESLPLIFILVDEKGQILKINRAGQIYLDRPRDELLGSFLYEKLKSSIAIELKKYFINPHAADDEKIEFESKEEKSEGEFQTLFWQIKSLKPTSSFPLNLHIIIACDVSEIRIVHEKMIKAQEELRRIKEIELQNRLLERRLKIMNELLDERNKLISVICHDISDPLTTVLFYTDAWGKHTPHDFSSNELVNLAAGNIQDIISHIKTKQIIRPAAERAPRSRTSVTHALMILEKKYQHKLNNKKQNLRIDGLERKDIFICVEETAFTHFIMGNIISNAIKFSALSQDIFIHVWLHNQKVYFSIIDFGIGMSEETRSRLFLPAGSSKPQPSAALLSRPGTANETGSGKGLFIVRSYIEECGGNIEVFSKEQQDDNKDHGTTFVLSFEMCSESVDKLKES
jgi:signal transduction histidine kinase